MGTSSERSPVLPRTGRTLRRKREQGAEEPVSHLAPRAPKLTWGLAARRVLWMPRLEWGFPHSADVAMARAGPPRW